MLKNHKKRGITLTVMPVTSSHNAIKHYAPDDEGLYNYEVQDELILNNKVLINYDFSQFAYFIKARPEIYLGQGFFAFSSLVQE